MGDDSSPFPGTDTACTNLSQAMEQGLPFSMHCLLLKMDDSILCLPVHVAHVFSGSSGNKEGARLFAENAIRQKSQHMNFLRLSSRIDAVASKLNNAVQMNMVSEKMAKITEKLAPTMTSMNTAKENTTHTASMS